MKRAFTIMLMTVVLLLSLLVPAGADHVPAQPTKVVPLWNADENWTNPGGFVVDRENQVEGEGCVSIRSKAKDEIDVHVTFPPVDGTGMLYLEFDIYAQGSSLLLTTFFFSHIELSSSGQTGKNAQDYKLQDFLSTMDEDCWLTGWKHVVIPLEYFADSQEENDLIDISSINFLRFSIVDMDKYLGPETEFVLKLDNFVLTDQATPPRPHTPEIIYSIYGHETMCTVCDCVIDFEEHTLPEGINPCTFEGEAECEICGITYEGTGHWYEDVVDEKYYAGPATCTHGEKYFYSCRRCGEMGVYIFTHGKTLPHSYTRLERVSAATCTQSAEYDYACRFCGRRQNQSFSDGEPLGHTESEEVVSLGARGHVHTCVTCDENMEEIFEHDFYEWKVLEEATPTKNGLRKRQCAFCTYSETREFVYVAPTVPDGPNTPNVPETPEDPKEPETPQTPAVPVAPSDDGCSAVLVSGAPAMLALIAAAGWMLRKKKK